MRTLTTIVVAVFCVAVSARDCLAQMTSGPPGVVGGLFGGRRPIDPNRSRQTLETTADLSGGYDRDPNGLLRDPSVDSTSPSEGWYAALASVSTRYRVGHVRRSLQASGRGTFNRQSNRTDTLIGGSGDIDGVYHFGRTGLNQLTLNLHGGREPGWAFGVINADLTSPATELGLDLAPQHGVIEQQWINFTGTLNYQQQWSHQHQSSLQVGGGRVGQVETRAGLESEWQNGRFDHNWSLSERIGLVASYQHNRALQRQLNIPSLPLEYQLVDAGVRLSRRISATRQMHITLRGGAARILGSSNGLPLQPSYSGGIEYVASRVWTFSAEGSHAVAVLPGVTPQPIVNNSIQLSTGGTIGRRVRLALIGSHQQGSGLVPQGALQLSSRTKATGATLEARYGVGRRAAFFGSYSYYAHELEGELVSVSGLPPQYDRRSARVGLTFWLPLYGAF